MNIHHIYIYIHTSTTDTLQTQWSNSHYDYIIPSKDVNKPIKSPIENPSKVPSKVPWNSWMVSRNPVSARQFLGTSPGSSAHISGTNWDAWNFMGMVGRDMVWKKYHMSMVGIYIYMIGMVGDGWDMSLTWIQTINGDDFPIKTMIPGLGRTGFGRCLDIHIYKHMYIYI